MHDGQIQATIWQQIEQLLADGINCIPVHPTSKAPYKNWEHWQTQSIPVHELFAQMQAHNTTSIAVVCGVISGNLVVIDIDTKHLPGIDILVFNAIRELHTELFNILRVHTSPSGGAHIVYRLAPGCQIPRPTNLAYRPATPDELQTHPRRTKYCFLELKAEGSLCGSPPSVGYTIRKPVPIPVLSWQQHCSLMEICKSFNQVHKPPEVYKPTVRDSNYYDENPFAHYNRTIDPVALLTGFGWTFVRHSGDYIWFTKPGGKRNDVHASYNTQKQYYYIFSNNAAPLDGDRAYLPASILAIYQFNGDKTATQAYLVQQGFGRIKPAMEARMAKTLAISGQPMPANASPAAQTRYIEIRANLSELHPHGIFWQPDQEGSMQITRLGIKDCAAAMGFCLYNEQLVQVQNNFIYHRTERFFYDALMDYIKEEDATLYEEIYNATDAHMQKNIKWHISNLPHIDTDKILCDTRNVCYKFYQNGYVEINKSGFELKEYSTITDKFIWHNKIQQRDYIYTNATGLYTDFLEFAVDLTQNKQHIMRCIGWLTHDYKDASTGYIIVLTEKCADPQEGGGSGKNLFCELLKNTTSYTSIPGTQYKGNEDNLLQSWNGERIFAISDARKGFDFETLKEPTTGSMRVKKLWKNVTNVSNKELPKFIVNTNYSYEVIDGGLKRRIIAIEFTDFFTKNNGIDVYFKKQFPEDFTYLDWANYDTFICSCIQEWLSNDCKLRNIELSDTGWEKQFFLTHGNTITNFIQENWNISLKDKFISTVDFNKLLWQYCEENNIQPKYKPSSFKINKALKDWCAKLGYAFEPQATEGPGDFKTRGRSFIKNK